MTINYCKNLWSKYAELRSAQAQAEADLELAQASGELETTKTSLDSFKLANDQMQAEWENSFATLPDGRKMFGPEFDNLQKIAEQNSNLMPFTQLVGHLTQFVEIKDGYVVALTQSILLEDISSIANFSRLRELQIGTASKVGDLSVLSGLKNLESLELDNTGVTDLTNISNLKKLRRLAVHNPLTLSRMDLSPLSGLTALETIDVQWTKADDLTPLSNLPRLKNLDMRNTAVRDITPLINTPLENITLCGSKVTDFSPFLKMRKINDIVCSQRDSTPERMAIIEQLRSRGVNVLEV